MKEIAPKLSEEDKLLIDFEGVIEKEIKGETYYLWMKGEEVDILRSIHDIDYNKDWNWIHRIWKLLVDRFTELNSNENNIFYFPWYIKGLDGMSKSNIEEVYNSTVEGVKEYNKYKKDENKISELQQ